MKPTFSDRFKRGFLLFFVAAMALFPAIIMAQGRTLTRANRIDHGGLQPGDHLKIEELVVFEGTWRWVSAGGDSVLTFQLWREKIVPPGETINYVFSYDAIAGHYSLTVRGAIVSSNIHNQKSATTGLPTFAGTDFDDDGVDVLRMHFHDFPKNRSTRGRFELLRENPDLARWTRWREGIVVRVTDEVFHRGFSLPNNVVLHRVEDTLPAPEPPPGSEIQ
ncbi:MAG TPA: DUF6705 family protein [Bacteroidales bacterium]|nr:DUF6705 family protein [Bacteroidales bacterium]